MTQESPAEQLRRLGGVGGQAQRPQSNPGPKPSPKPKPGAEPGVGYGQPPKPGAKPVGPPQPRLPDGYLKDGYFDAKGNIHERLIVSDALEIARNLEAGRMSRSQLRNFYNEADDIRHLLRLRPDSFEALKARVLKLCAFAHNATTRSSNKAPQLFYDFICENTRLASQTPQNFLEGFCEHFECVVLYFKGR